MLKFLLILAAWITPGVLLFFYLLWISKRKETSLGKPKAPAAVPADFKVTKDELSERPYPQPNSLAPSRREVNG